MNGLKTIVVMDDFDIQAGVNLRWAMGEIAEMDDNRVSTSQIIEVRKAAWIGGWFPRVNVICTAMQQPNASFDVVTTRDPKLFVDGREVPIFPGSVEKPGDFFLNLDQFRTDWQNVDLQTCARNAAKSLLANDADNWSYVYGVIMSEYTYLHENSTIMLEALRDSQWEISGRGMKFEIRVFVVPRVGQVQMHRL